MKANRIIGVALLVVSCLGFVLAQPPTRVYGPAGIIESQSIYTYNSIDYYTWYYGTTIAFGINAGSQGVSSHYAFVRWQFSGNNLPPGSEIVQVQLRFKANRHPSQPGDHCSFSMYDIKLPITGVGNREKYLAMDQLNWVLDGQTVTVNGEEWFDVTRDQGELVTSIQSALTSNRNYTTFGFKRNPEFGPDLWWDLNTTLGGNISSLELTVWFRPPEYTIQFKNDLDGASYGTITVDGNQLNSGASLPFYWGDQTTVTAYTGRYQYGSNNWKYQTWDLGDPNNNQNPKTFTVFNANPITAYFNQVFDVTVRNDFEGSEAGQLTYQGNPVNTGYTEQDVFRNYTRSFSAITPQTDGGFTWNFQRWDDGVTALDRQITVWTTMTFSARSKAHLASSLSSATATAGQRKLARNLDQPYNLVYASSGEIYITKSSDAESWTPELRISGGNGGFGAPSIAVGADVLANPSEDDAYVVFRRWDVYNYKIYSRVRQNGIWGPQLQVNIGEIQIADPYPVIARTNVIVSVEPVVPQLLAVWETQSGLTTAYSRFSGGQWGLWQGHQQLTSSSWVRPSFSSTKVDGSEQRRVYLTYDNGSDIGMTSFLNGWSWTHETIPASVSPVAYASQVAANTFGNEDTVHVVWEAIDDGKEEEESSLRTGSSEKRKVMYQRKAGIKWGTAHEFKGAGTLSFYRPSVMPLDNGLVTMTFDNGTAIYGAVSTGGEWSGVNYHGYAGTHASLVNAGTSSLLTTPKYAMTNGTVYGPPYPILIDYGPPDAPEGESLAEIYSRRVVIAEDRDRGDLKTSSQESAANFSIELNKLEVKLVDGSVLPVEFIPANNMIPGQTENDPWKGLSSTRITIPQEVDSIIINGLGSAFKPGSLTGNGEQGLRVSFQVLDAPTGEVLRTLSLEKLFSKTGKKRLHGRERFRGLAGRQVIIRPRLKGVRANQDDIFATLVHVHTVIEHTGTQPVATVSKAEGSTMTGLPTDFILHPNYPNPFNPSTQINFDLPEASNVSLVVYDVLGREVATLATGYREAGYHMATWNARPVNGTRDVSSGVYFARFTASDVGGNVRYTKINKLVLMK